MCHDYITRLIRLGKISNAPREMFYIESINNEGLFTILGENKLLAPSPHIVSLFHF